MQANCVDSPPKPSLSCRVKFWHTKFVSCLFFFVFFFLYEWEKSLKDAKFVCLRGETSDRNVIN